MEELAVEATLGMAFVPIHLFVVPHGDGVARAQATVHRIKLFFV